MDKKQDKKERLWGREKQTCPDCLIMLSAAFNLCVVCFFQGYEEADICLSHTKSF